MAHPADPPAPFGASEPPTAAGEHDALPLLYRELRQLAHRHLAGERADHTLRTTALVHEAYLKLGGTEGQSWNDRTHFLAVASRAMRQVLTDYARARRRAKRGGGAVHLPLDEVAAIVGQRDAMFLALDEALERLERANPRQCRVVECRFYSGLSIAETASALDVSVNTVKRDWALARAWLNQELEGE